MIPRLRRYLRAGFIFTHDGIMASISFVIALALSLGNDPWDYSSELVIFGTAAFTVVAMAVFGAMRIHRDVWQYTLTPEIVRILGAVTLIILLFVVGLLWITRLDALPRSILIINYLVLVALMLGPRILYRIVQQPVLMAGLLRKIKVALMLGPRILYRIVQQPVLMAGLPRKIKWKLAAARPFILNKLRTLLFETRAAALRRDFVYTRFYAPVTRKLFVYAIRFATALCRRAPHGRLTCIVTLNSFYLGRVLGPVFVNKAQARHLEHMYMELLEQTRWEPQIALNVAISLEQHLLIPRQAVAVYAELCTRSPESAPSAFKEFARLYSLAAPKRADFFYEVQKALKGRSAIGKVAEVYQHCATLLEYVGELKEALSCYDKAIAYLPFNESILKSIYFQKSLLETLIATGAQTSEAVSFAGEGKRILIGSVFWGRPYVEQACETAIPTFLDSIEIDPSLGQRFDFHFLLCCSPLDRTYVMSSAIWPRIKDRTTFCLIPSHIPHQAEGAVMNASKYVISMWYQTLMGFVAGNNSAGIVNVPPDAIFSNNAMSMIARTIARGKAATIIPGLRVEREQILPALDAFRREDGSVEAVESRRLTEVALRALHQGTKALIRNKPDGGLTLPGILLWKTKSGGLIGHFAHLHPIYIDSCLTKNAPIRCFDSIDGEYLESLMDEVDESELDILCESDDVMMWAQDPAKHIFDEFFGREVQLEAGLPWLVPIISRRINRHFFKARLHFGAQDKDEEIEELADRDVACILSHADLPSSSSISECEKS